MTTGELSRPLQGYPLFKAAAPTVPEGGWTQENFESRNGRLLQRAIASRRASIMAAEMRGAIKFLQEHFTAEMEDIISLAESYHGVKAAGEVANNLKAWHRAIKNGVRKWTPKLVQGMAPRLERTGRRIIWDTARLLGIPAKDIDPKLFHANAKEIAKRLKGLAETTKRRLAGAVSQAIKDQLTLKQTIEKLRKRFPQLTLSRITTIARTEIGRAADAGQRAAFRLHGKVTHISVVGCKHVEPCIHFPRPSPTYKGIPTCNIRNVPEKHSEKLEFHINHTGSMVPSGFKKKNGQAPRLRLARGRGLSD